VESSFKRFINIVIIVSIGVIDMETTTIQLSKLTRDKIASFGMKGESYEEIINRIYSLAVKEQLRQFLMSEEGFVPIEEAIKEAKKKWPK